MMAQTSRCRTSSLVYNSFQSWARRTFLRAMTVSSGGKGSSVALDSVESRSHRCELDVGDGGGPPRHEHLLLIEFALPLSFCRARMARLRDSLSRPTSSLHRSKH